MNDEKFRGRLAVPVPQLPDATGIESRVWAREIKAGNLPVVEVTPRRRVVLVQDLEAFLRARRTSA